jgi:hypothetical protein
MNIEKEVIILAKSKKYNNYCIAGYDVNDDTLVRIISDNPRIHFSVPGNDIVMSNTNTEAGLLDVVRLQARKVQPGKDNPHQVENWEYDDRVKWQKIRSIGLHELPQKCLSDEEYLFFNNNHFLNKQDMKSLKCSLKSLQFIEPTFLEFFVKKYEEIKIYANLKWKGQVYKKLALTDLHFENIMKGLYTKYKKEYFFITPTPKLLVSLSGIFERNLCYYKLIASIVSANDSKVCPKNALFYQSLKYTTTKE